jgi:hypothetical protein
MADVVFVTTAGLQIIADRLKGVGNEPKYMGWGIGGATVAATTDTGLVTASTEARATSTSSHETTVYANDTYRTVGAIRAETDKTISEFSLFDDPSTGKCFLRATFTGIALLTGDSLRFTNGINFVST